MALFDLRKLSTVFALWAAAAGCRQEPIDEVVYTGRRVSPSSPDAGTTTISVDAGQLDRPFTKAALLEEIGSCTYERVRTFEARARALRDATAAYAASRTAETRDAARGAWRDALVVWEELEVLRIGPAASREEPGGLGLRDQIYGWPLVNACKIDEQLVAGSYAEASFASSLINGRGLGAIERLLFYEGTTNGCSEFSMINATGAWSALDARELARRRADYAAAAAAAVAAQASALERAWSPDGGDFLGAWSRAGLDSPLFASEQAALNVASDAMFYLEFEVKDLKLSRPMGLRDCGSPPCVGLVESPWAGASTAHLAANLRGFSRMFSGCGHGIGFDDWLVAAGAGELSARMSNGLAHAISVVDRLEAPLDAVLIRDPRGLDAVHGVVKSVTDPLKTELTSVLDLELPRAVEGDND